MRCYQRTKGVLDRMETDSPCVTTQRQDVHPSVLHFQDSFLAATISARRTTKLKQTSYPRFYPNKLKKYYVLF